MRRMLFFLITALFLHGCSTETYYANFDMVNAPDGVNIAYSVYGDGKVSLVFVHGWSCDSGYWQNQVPYFSKDYKVVTIDLAGHGDSGANRKNYTVESFAGDIKSVVEEQNLRKVILIGHSMSGYIIAHAANMMPERVIGIIGVDTIHNTEHKLTKEQYNEFVSPFESNFTAHTDSFVRGMFTEKSSPDLINKIAKDMSSAPEDVAVSSLKNYLNQFVMGESSQVFETIDVPVWVVNADLWDMDTGSNRKHIKNFNALIIEGSGHFPMLEKPDEFNRLLSKAVRKIRD